MIVARVHEHWMSQSVVDTEYDTAVVLPRSCAVVNPGNILIVHVLRVRKHPGTPPPGGR